MKPKRRSLSFHFSPFERETISCASVAMKKLKGDEEKSDGLEITSVGSLYVGLWDKKYWSSSRVWLLFLFVFFFFFFFSFFELLNYDFSLISLSDMEMRRIDS